MLKMSKPSVAVAMSGGVDSAVAAYLAIRAGNKVTAIHLKMEAGQPADPVLYECCRMLDIPLIEHECSREFFEKVLYASACEYAAGRTPNPCCQCNKVLKFAELFKAADKLGIGHVMTGHYVNRFCDDGHYYLSKGADSGKDQSYFLYRLTGDELARVSFPLGNLHKEEVRRIAAEAGLPCAVRKDSQDACFQIPGECCGETLRRRCQVPVKKGRFIHNGKVVGRHDGIHRYTLGQRQGLNVALGVPAYIRSISAKNGNIELTTDQNELMSKEFTVKEVSWVHGCLPQLPLTVKVRYRSPGVECDIEEVADGRIVVHPVRELRAVTPGQAAVFYCEDKLLGGGVIENV